MFTLAHLSDVHLGPLPKFRRRDLMGKRMLGYLNWRRRQQIHRRETLDALVGDLHQHHPQHIAVTGDLINIGLPAEYVQALHWLEGLGTPQQVTVIPGNHDAYVRLWRDPGIERWASFMTANADAAPYAPLAGRRRFPFLRLFGDIALIGLSSAQPTLPGVAAGRVGPGQRTRLADLLEVLGRAGLCRVVLIHHPPLPGMTGWHRALHDARALETILVRQGAELVLHGHNHEQTASVLATVSGVLPIIGAPSASATPPLTMTGKPHMTKPPARYNLFTIGRDGGGWRIEMTGRGFDRGNGELRTLERTTLSGSFD